MSFTLKENKSIGEKYYYKKHKSGLDVYVFPKEMGTSYAAFATKFGSVDREFLTDSRRVVLPDGVAHFLEHKMFENSDGRDTFELYAKTGASANAYTSNNRTVYLFSAAENISESLEILLSFVTDPYFTKETIAKEQGIIGQEIKMYDDNPDWQLYFGMLEGMYANNPVKIDIAGTVETIAEITPDTLFDAYNTFYNLDNMVLVVSGNVIPDEVDKVCDKVLEYKKAPEIKRIYPQEPKGVNKEFVTKKMQVAMPMFSIGIKDNTCPMTGKALGKKRAVYGILMDMMFSKSAPFYTRLMDEGLIDSGFSFAYEGHETFGYAELAGNSNDPRKVYEQVQKEIEYYKQNGLDKEAFERIKRANFAHLLRMFNSTDDIANEMVSALFDGLDILDYPEICSGVTFEDVTDLLMNNFSEFTLSEIYPL
ncbi:MAG: insulinase family protein [Oscillospiraceae bacterium]|nr:insulinase family protein [Oscillospiraceae bacterium]